METSFFDPIWIVSWTSNQSNSQFVIKLMKYKTVKKCNFKDYTANSRVSDVILLNGHQNLQHKHCRAAPFT